MADENDSLTGQLNQVGGTATPSSGSARPGYGGVLDNIINGTGGLTGPDAVRQLLDPGGETNPSAPSGSQGPTLEVEPDILGDTIKVYDDEIDNFAKIMLDCDSLGSTFQPPGNEFASKEYAAKYVAATASLQQAIRSHIDELTNRRNMLQASLDSYRHTESTNARVLRPKDHP